MIYVFSKIDENSQRSEYFLHFTDFESIEVSNFREISDSSEIKSNCLEFPNEMLNWNSAREVILLSKNLNSIDLNWNFIKVLDKKEEILEFFSIISQSKTVKLRVDADDFENLTKFFSTFSQTSEYYITFRGRLQLF